MKIFQKWFLSSVVLGSFFIELPAQATPLLNEIYIGDSNFAESGHHNTSAYQDNYVELVGVAGESLYGYSIVQIDGSGQVVSHHTFGTYGSGPGSAPNMNPGDSLDGGTGYYFVAGQASAQSGTWFLVENFSFNDAVTDLDTNDDGILDLSPLQIVDSVGWASPSTGGFVYSTAVLEYSNISNHAIEAAGRIVADTNANNTSSWFYGDTNPNLTAPNGGDYAANFNGFTYNLPFNNVPGTIVPGTTPGWDSDHGEYQGHRNYSGVIIDCFDYATCPEPSSLILSGLLGIGAAFQRRRKKMSK